MEYTVCVVHAMKSKKMSRHDAEQFKSLALARMKKPSVVARISETMQRYLPESLKNKAAEIVEQRQKSVINSVEIVSEGRDKCVVVVKNTVHASQNHTLSEAVYIKEELNKSLGKMRSKNSTLDIEIVAVEQSP